MTSCWICSGETSADPELGEFGYVRCSRCGFVQRPDEGTRELYEGGAYEQRDMGAQYVDESMFAERRANARARLRWVARHVPTGGRLLDVGAAGGEFVLEAGEAGFAAEGIEPSPAFAAHARDALGVDVRHGRLEDVPLADGAFAVITMWHVLEHIVDPVAALRRVRAALAPEGRLVIEVPNVDSIHARMFGTAWPGLEPTAHVSQFTPRSLGDALVAAGLQVTVSTTVAHATYLTRAERLAPRALISRVKLALRGAPAIEHPTRHEYARAVARRPVTRAGQVRAAVPSS